MHLQEKQSLGHFSVSHESWHADVERGSSRHTEEQEINFGRHLVPMGTWQVLDVRL